jgi:hypothetical protein
MYEVVCDHSPFRSELVRKRTRFLLCAWIIEICWILDHPYGVAVVYKLKKDKEQSQ